MRILLVRHAQSQGQIDKQAYRDDGDQNVEITEQGWQQSFALGGFLRRYYQANAPFGAAPSSDSNAAVFAAVAQPATPKWPRMYISPYTRPQQTMSGAWEGGLKDLLPGKPRLRQDPRLAEKHYGAENVLEALANDPSDPYMQQLAKALLAIYERTQQGDPYTSRRLFGDASKDTNIAVKSFIASTLQSDIEGIPGVQEPCDDFIIWAHGAVIKDFLMSWYHINMKDRDDVPSPGNCDVFLIEGTRGHWKPAMRIWDGEAMKDDSTLFLDGLRPFGIDDLPPVPQHVRAIAGAAKPQHEPG